MADIILGSDLMIFKGGKALAAATNCKLDVNAGTLETSSKDSGCWKSVQGGKLSWTCSSDNLFVVADYTSLVDALIARTPVELQFSTVSNGGDCSGAPLGGWTASADGYKGSAIITSISASASDGENATYSVNFEGCTPLTAVGA